MAPNGSNGYRTSGLVRVMSAQDIIDIEAKEVIPTDDGGEDFVSTSVLSGHIRKIWERNKLHKERVSQKLLKCLRARRGLYSPMEIAAMQEMGGMNIIWADLTETKCRAASAWIRDIVMPAGDRAWAIEPTPIPDLPIDIKDALLVVAADTTKQAMIAQAQSGNGVMTHHQFEAMAQDLADKHADQVLQTVRDKADQAAKRMEDKVQEYMDEGGYDKAMDEFIEDFVTYPAAILKGPVYHRRKQLEWLPGWKAGVSDKPQPVWSRVSPFDIYPAPHSSDCQSGELMERLRFQRHELFGLIGVEGYDEDAIRNVLEVYTNGYLEAWLWTESERKRLEEESLYEWLSPAGVIDGLHYWGSVPGWMLITWGMSEKVITDPLKEYEVDAVLIGNYIIRCALNAHPLGQRPYHRACYDPIPGAFWGRSIPDLGEYHQKMCNALACSMADNLAMSSGPMMWVHADRLADGSDPLDIAPWRIYQLKSDASQGTNPGIGWFQAQSNVTELNNLYASWEQRSDDATGIPRYTYGNEKIGGAGSTASGLSMLMNNASKGLRRAISSVDEVVAASVYQMFLFEMLYGTDRTVKGDCCVVPRGAAAILIKDGAQRNRQMAMQIIGGNPMAMQIVGMRGFAELLRESIASLELPVDKIVPDDETIQGMVQAQQQQAQKQQQAIEQAQQAALGQQQQQMQLEQRKADLEEQRTNSASDPNQAKAEAQVASAEVSAASRERIAGAQIARDMAIEKMRAPASTPGAMSSGVSTTPSDGWQGSSRAGLGALPQLPAPGAA